MWPVCEEAAARGMRLRAKARQEEARSKGYVCETEAT